MPFFAIISFTGERFDFVLSADQPVDNYWFRAEGQADCGFHPTNIIAVVRYEGATDALPSDPENYERKSGVVSPHSQKLLPIITLGQQKMIHCDSNVTCGLCHNFRVCACTQ